MADDSLIQGMFTDEEHPDSNPKRRNLKYPLHYYGMTDKELKVVGVMRNAHGKLVDIPKKEKRVPLVREKKVKERKKPAVMSATDVGVVEGIPVEEVEFLESSLEELEARYRPEYNFFELAGFQPKQMEAHEAVMTHKYILYGGAAGGGKSYFLRWEAIFQLMYLFDKYKAKGIRVGIFCEDYPSLKERHLSKVEFEFPEFLGTLNKSEHEFRLRPEYGGGIIAFRNLDEPSKYLSSEFACVFVDEITRDPKEVFNFLVMRMRWKGVRSEDNRFIAASNPGGVGHSWVKGLWIDRDFREYPDLLPSEVKYVKALYSDNKYIDPAYGLQLGMLPENIAKAYRDGSWDIFAGQFFTEFDRDVHVIDPITDAFTLELFKKLPVYVGLDYGYRKPSAVIFGRFWDNEWYIFDEIYVVEKTYEQLRDLIQEKAAAGGFEVELIFADPAIWAKKDSPVSGADKLAPLAVRPAMNERVVGWTLCREFFRTKSIKIFNTCTHLIRTIPNMVHHEKKVEDLDTNGEDHAVDALRYLLVTHKHIIQQQEILTYTPRYEQSESDLEEVFRPQGEHPALYTMGFIRPNY